MGDRRTPVLREGDRVTLLLGAVPSMVTPSSHADPFGTDNDSALVSTNLSLILVRFSSLFAKDGVAMDPAETVVAGEAVLAIFGLDSCDSTGIVNPEDPCFDQSST